MNYTFLPLTMILCTTACSSALTAAVPTPTQTTNSPLTSVTASYEQKSNFLWFPWYYIEHRVDDFADSIIDIVEDSIDIYWDSWTNAWNFAEIYQDSWKNAWDSVDKTIWKTTWDSIDENWDSWETVWDSWESAWDSIDENWDSLENIWDIDTDTISNSILRAFLNQSNSVDKQGKAWQAYDNSQIIAGEDICDQEWFYIHQGGERIKCLGAYLNGTDTVLIVYANEETVISIESAFEQVDGRFKLVHVKPDGTTKRIDNSGLNAKRDITLQKGRNAIKLVGQAAKLNRLTVSYYGLTDNKNITAVYYSEEEEYAATILEEIKSGTFDKNKLKNTLPYIDEDAVSKVLEALLQQEIPVTKEELLYLFMYSDEDLSSQYLLEAIKNGKTNYFDIDYFSALLPYLEEQYIGNILSAISDKISFELIDTWKYYLDEETLEQCLIKFLEDGNTLTYSQFYKISPYLGESTIKKIDNLLKTK